MTVQSAGPVSGLLHLHPSDNIVVAIRPLAQGEIIDVGGQSITVPRDVSLGHKLALVDIAEGCDVLKYGAPIGFASSAISAGDHVHLHNLTSRYTVIEDIEGTNA